MHSKDDYLIRKFPWMTTLKRSVILLLFAVVSTIVFYSVEECLQHNKTQVKPYQAQEMKRCLEIVFGSHVERFAKENSSLINITSADFISQCQKVILPVSDNEKHHCNFTWKQIMKWAYHVVISLFGIGRTTKHLTGLWSQFFNVFFIFFGVILTTRVYMWVGFIGVNLVNIFLKRAKEIVNYKWIPRQKFQIVVLSFALLVTYAIICATITTIFSNKTFSFHLVYTWLMIMFCLSDENLLAHAYKNKPADIIVPIFLVVVGFTFTSTLIAALINVKYRLTYTLKKTIVKSKKGKMQGCLV
ncbi:uncharacterized protein LOC130624347 [Hydractinia symbiolongicarpus]|uniref:uncharacterized protein LOC130624347 n=1 Tax=Hydractinia symbiolongicarpus TaxID=13093 RepID=UPI00254EA9A2|nr:uncharacterized protein LOC130624347 [Hydractinia symbiolongicarpus]